MRLAKGKFFHKVWLAFTFVAIAFAAIAQYPERPNPPRLVNDFAGFLGGDEDAALEQKLQAFKDSTSTTITIVTINTLDGADKAQYATELGEKWGVGGKAKDNGIVVLISKEDRQLFIATGRGVEEYLPDAICKRIVENKIKPYFKQGEYYAGLNAATTEMMARLNGTFVADETGGEKRGLPIWAIILIIVVVFFILPTIFRGGGGGGTTFGGRGYNSWGGGLGGFGGFGGGGSSSGGGGGFSGFGGGSFGGGGAGGSW